MSSAFRMPDANDAARSKAIINSRQFMQLQPSRDLYPAGYFNERKREREGAGPMGTLLDKAPRANSMRDGINRNLIHTQLAARVNVTRYILPLKLPGVFAFPEMLEVKKTFVSGDVMFALRYTSAMFEQGIATNITRKPPPLHMTGVNLPTLNYILVNYQQFVWDEVQRFFENNENANYVKSRQSWKNYFSSLYIGLLERNNFMQSNLTEFKDELAECNHDILSVNVLMQVHVWKFLRNFVRVAGVFIGSEEQGGQNQGAANPASHNPSDFMSAMQISGKFENVRNLWTTSGGDVSNGDTLGFTLACIDPHKQTSLRMQLSGNAVTHQQVTFDFSTLNGMLKKRFNTPEADADADPGVKIWVLTPAIQNRLKHNIGLADASVTTAENAAHIVAETGIVHAYALGSNLKGEFFMQFGLVNQMSKGVAGSMRAFDYAKDATACTVPTNSEVLLRFTVGDPSVERVHTEEEVLAFARARTGKNAGLTLQKGQYRSNEIQQAAQTRTWRDLKFWKEYGKDEKNGHTILSLFGIVQKKPTGYELAMQQTQEETEIKPAVEQSPQKQLPTWQDMTVRNPTPTLNDALTVPGSEFMRTKQPRNRAKVPSQPAGESNFIGNEKIDGG